MNWLLSIPDMKTMPRSKEKEDGPFKMIIEMDENVVKCLLALTAYKERGRAAATMIKTTSIAAEYYRRFFAAGQTQTASQQLVGRCFPRQCTKIEILFSICSLMGQIPLRSTADMELAPAKWTPFAPPKNFPYRTRIPVGPVNL